MKHYSEGMETFIFRKSWGEVFKVLPEDKAGQLIKAIYAHISGEEATIEDVMLNSVLKSITKEIDLNAYKFLLKAGYISEE